MEIIKFNFINSSQLSFVKVIRKNYLEFSYRSCALLTLLLLWYLFTGPLQLIPSIKFPSMNEVYESVLTLINPGYAGATLLGHILSSLQLVLMGFCAAITTGFLLGLLMGLNRSADSFLNPLFQLLRPIAPIAWIPLTILWLGLGISAKVFVIWLAAFAPMLINTYTGVRNIPRIYLEAAKTLGASRYDVLTHVIILGALPTIFTGLRISLQACWMVLVAAELVGSFKGFGHILISATRDLDPAMIFTAMISIAFFGAFLNWILTKVENKAIPWHQ